MLFGAGLACALIRRERKALLFVVAPTLVVLAFIQPSDGMWRFHWDDRGVCAASVAVGVPGHSDDYLTSAPR